MKKFSLLLFLLISFACKNAENQPEASQKEPGKALKIENAKGFSIVKFKGYSLLKVNSPWPDAKKPFTYLLVRENGQVPDFIDYDEKITIPVKRIVVTSTTHIPALEALNEENTLKGFPGLPYISSPKTRQLIKNGKISELGQTENMNTEVLINLDPDLVIGFSIDGSNKNFETFQKSGIPVVYNGEWTESTPLGKAEWIKFFGVLFGKEKEADSIFSTIKSDYLASKELAKQQKNSPSVLSGSMFRDQWYLPYGNSWQAQFIQDANAHYIYANTQGEGSMSLSFESVLEKAGNADFWISAGQFESYEQLYQNSEHYKQFKAVQDKNVYSVSVTKGETGGILFYELGPQRPDLILKDLISIFHPGTLPEYQPVFFKPLQ